MNMNFPFVRLLFISIINTLFTLQQIPAAM